MTCDDPIDVATARRAGYHVQGKIKRMRDGEMLGGLHWRLQWWDVA